MTTCFYQTSDDTGVYARVLQTLLSSYEDGSAAGEPAKEYPTLKAPDMLKGLLDHPTLVLIAYFILFMILRKVLGIG